MSLILGIVEIFLRGFDVIFQALHFGNEPTGANHHLPIWRSLITVFDYLLFFGNLAVSFAHRSKLLMRITMSIAWNDVFYKVFKMKKIYSEE